MQSIQSMIQEELSSVLSWQNSFDSFLSAISESHSQFVQLQIEKVLSKTPHLFKAILNAFEGLDSNSKDRLIYSPNTPRHIYLSLQENNPEILATYLLKSILAEKAVFQGYDGFKSTGIWTSLEDYFMPKDGSTFERMTPNSPHGIIINFNGPLARQKLANRTTDKFEFSDFKSYSTSQQEYITDGIHEGLTGIQKVASPAYRFILENLKMSIPRWQPGTRFRGSTEITQHGRAFLYNAHDVLSGKIACSLLHEAIHLFLFSIEERFPFVLPQNNPKVQSPWTGNVISTRCYVHSCFVWFGLNCFWNRHVGTDVFRKETESHYFNLTGPGWKPGALEKSLKDIRNAINPVIFDQLMSLGKFMAK